MTEDDRFRAYCCAKCAKNKTGKCRERLYRLYDGTLACHAYRCAAIEGRTA